MGLKCVYCPKMSGLHVMCAVLVCGWLGRGADSLTDVVHEVYLEKDNTNRSVACGVCEGSGGHLARRPKMSDWEYFFGNWSRMENETFWVDLIKMDTGEWVWGDGVALNTAHISALAFTPPHSGNYSSEWTCAVWSIVEPFLFPANCSMTTNILCQIPPGTTLDCDYIDVTETEITNSTPVLATPTPSTPGKAECVQACRSDDSCWAGDWNSDTSTCQLLLDSPSVEPAVPAMGDDSLHTVFYRKCHRFQEMSPEESEFVCNCGAMEIPETEEAKEQFLQEHKEEVQKELILPTETLSATVRKKVSAPDERPSSTSFGYLGVTLMVVVFGGLVLMDLDHLRNVLKAKGKPGDKKKEGEEKNVSEA